MAMKNPEKTPLLIDKSTISMAMFNGYVSHYPRLVETIGAGDVRHESLGNALGSCRLLSGRGSIRRRGGAVRQQRPGRWPEKWRLKGRFFC